MSNHLKETVPLERVVNQLFDEAERTETAPSRLLATQATFSISQSRRWLACAHGQKLVIHASSLEKGPSLAGRADFASNEVITALKWISHYPSNNTRGEAVDFLLCGTSLGFLQWCSTEGDILARRRIHQTACCSIVCRCRGQGLDVESTSEEVTVGFLGGVVRISALEALSFFEQLRNSKQVEANSSAMLSHTKWEFPRGTGHRHAVICLGSKVPSLHERMLGRSSSPKLLILSGGEKPSLATHEAPEWGNEGIMAAVSELASGVAGLAKTLVAGRANGYRAGLGNWLGRSGQQKKEDEKGEISPGHASSLSLSVQDEPRTVTSLAIASRGPLAAAADSLGRVLLFDFSNLTVLRIWKSYRHAQIAWISQHTKGGQNMNLLILYSPGRAKIEVWDPLHNPLAEIPACKQGVLLIPSPQFGSSAPPPAPCLLDCATGVYIDIGKHVQSLFPSRH